MDKSMLKPLGRIASIIHRFIEFIARWLFLAAAEITGKPEVMPPINNNITMHNTQALAMMIRQKKLKCVDVMNAYIERIETVQPILNCVAEDRFKEALEEAKECDKLLNSPDAPSVEELEKNKPFFGVPFTTKDCIGVKNMKQTAGLLSRRNTRSERDAEAISLMKKAGAIVIATTNVSELAMWWESSNLVYGTTRNPYNTWHIVGGSSGGEGCIQAAAGVPFGIGSDIGGSIRMPCFFNGIFGHKPTKGVVSNDGQYPSAQTDEQKDLLAIGPMCRFATDLKPILKILAGENAEKLDLNAKVDLSKLKFYYMEDDGGQFLVSPVSKDIKLAMSKLLYTLEIAHNVKAEKIKIKKFKKGLALWFANMTSPEGKDFAWELSNRKGRLSIWWEFVKWLTRTGSHTFVAISTAAFEGLSMRFNDTKRAQLLEESKDLRREFSDLLGTNGVFLYPTHPTPAAFHHEPLLKPFNFAYTAIINVLGFPATACPLGFSNGLPIGIQVVAGLYQDHLSLAVAEEIERAFGGWQMPPVKP
ncbi:fatty-acid amide hydrolase 2 [Diachasma alloeum]|uniref:fatty-acid amide hydrolase 2 n=1 Tax=Diachasma alloeum TaxID=454923 RepID=UPI00073835B9|nr:fatty-acid amide hydrolase 2 [Diachasma alloeum]XP_015113823.1 fatty-acid amide hydrolase 2 [Diachasma alloeum]XP_015113824.1 fatty-acid amide hydrolase 2 [Diachasma alloeum]XP_015113825.1 fatty-acid amide hydrolase 2 [Diachasma alloeum]XP_015113826.1 fatty-acid amide hydrolase 2 [Diachasma alloeum]XP_015113827.1 fatty-acid amide hydrolase 2 [Diachasma alloeum]